jgi:hypothetical protein
MADPNEQGISGPPTAGDEAATLLGSLERQRATFAWKWLRSRLGVLASQNRCETWSNHP